MNTMWCIQCRQDVPGLVSSDGGYCCPRCGQGVGGDVSAAASTPASPAGEPKGSKKTPPAPGTADTAKLPYDEWEVSQELRHIERVLHPADSRSSPTQAGHQHDRPRLDAPHAAAPPWHVRPAAKASRPERRQATSTAENLQLAALTWIALSLGTMAFACGGMLLGWSVVGGRQELWNIGTPVALCGQIALLIGLVLQLDRLWSHSRRAASKLDTVDDQLHELKNATTLLGTAHGPSGAFYAHFADGASPQLLLSDLKSQLDLLALKMSTRDDA